MSVDSEKFARLGQPRRIWAVGAVHGAADRLAVLHDLLWQRVTPGDRLVYLGNMIGRAGDTHATLAELLSFRRALIARPGMFASDVVYLRGAQEEMWQKLLQLQFAPNPTEVLRWMLSQGVETTLAAYGGDPDKGQAAAREGAVQITRWTNELREAMRRGAGHTALFAALRRAALTGSDDPDSAGGVLLVSAGLDPARPLAAQADSFWWATGGFRSIEEPYQGFVRLVRGFDPGNRGVEIGAVTATLDAGCGRGGGLAAGVFAADGTFLELLEA